MHWNRPPYPDAMPSREVLYNELMRVQHEYVRVQHDNQRLQEALAQHQVALDKLRREAHNAQRQQAHQERAWEQAGQWKQREVRWRQEVERLQSERDAALAAADQQQAQAQEAAVALHQEIAALKAERDALRARQAAPTEDASALQDRALRLQADIANLRRRQGEEMAAARRSARAEVLQALVETLDNIERAIASNPDRESAWYQGMEGIRRQLELALERQGVERLGAPGQPFDPRLHEALASAPAAEGAAPDTIAEVIRPGFRFADGTLLRPAQVVVAG